MMVQHNARALEPYDNRYELIRLTGPNELCHGKPGGKQPLASNWRLSQPLTTDDAKAHFAAGKNIGIRLRNVDLVLDVDPRHGGDESLERLAAELDIDFADWPIVWTGSGGRHIYMKKPAGVKVAAKVPGHGGIDIKTVGGFVVSSGSVHANGVVYRWDDDPLSVPLSQVSDAPGSLIELLGRPECLASDGPGEIDVDDLATLLACLDVCEFNDELAWREIMMASHHATNGAGIDVFVEWSLGDARYAEATDDIRMRWNSLAAKPDGIKVGTLFKAVVEAGHPEIVKAITASNDFAGVVEDSVAPRLVPPMLAEVNARHFTVLTAGKYLVGRESVCPHFGHVVVEWYPDMAVQKHLNVSTVTLADGTRRPLGTWWIKHEGRRQYDGVVFDPTPGSTHHGLYNLWRGWAVSPIRGDWTFMQQLLREVLCAGDQASFEYVLKWAAYMVQHPNSPAEVALVFKGKKGIGKGTFLRALKDLAGQHGQQVAQPEHFTGKFNEHLADKILLFVDEGLWAGDRKLEGALKNLITEPVLTFEGKHKPVVSGPNRLHVVIASNEDWVVPASDDERRFAVFEADSEAHRNLPPGFFGDLRRQMESGGLAAMLFDLEEMPLSGWHPRSDIPVTRALTEQKVQSFRNDPIVQWWYRALEDGCLPIGGTWDEPQDIDSEGKVSLVYAVQHQATAMKKRAEFTKTALARFLGKVGVDVSARDRKGGKVWRIPALPDARAAFDAWVGGPIGWDEGDEQA